MSADDPFDNPQLAAQSAVFRDLLRAEHARCAAERRRWPVRLRRAWRALRGRP